MCPPMRGQGGEPTEGTVLQHHCLSLVTKGGGRDAEKGCFPLEPLIIQNCVSMKNDIKIVTTCDNSRSFLSSWHSSADITRLSFVLQRRSPATFGGTCCGRG